MGAAGAGISTLISRITGAVVMLVVVHNQSRPIHYDAKFKLGYVPGIIKEILHIGVPTVVDASVFQVGKLLVQGLVASFGTASIAANAVIGSVSGFALIPSAAIGLALLTVVGQTMGTKVYEDVKYYVKKLLKSTYISMIILNIVIIIFSKQIAGLYNLSPEAYEMSWKIIIFHGFAAMSVYPLAFALPNALRAADDAKFTMIVSIFSMWVWRIGFSYILSNNLGLGLYGTWFAMFIDWSFRGVCFLLRQLSGKWMN
jgi:Na+-driven multidrug efflux pump